MKAERNEGVFGFRFNDLEHLPLCNLFAVGHDRVQDTSYCWDGLHRADGPLLLLQYTVNGTGIFEYNNERYTIGPGKAFLAEIPGPHRYYYPGGNQPWEFYFLLFRPHMILPLWEEVKDRLGPAPSMDKNSLPIRMLRDLFAEAYAGRITDPYIASSLVYQLMIELARGSSAGQRKPSEWPDSVQKAVHYIEANYKSMMGQEQLADKLGLSKFHMLRIFSKYVGVTPNEYLNRIRIEQAIQLLRTKDWTIEKVAVEVGYSTGSYFIKVFQKLTGQTPGSFRSGAGSLKYNRLFFD